MLELHARGKYELAGERGSATLFIQDGSTVLVKEEIDLEKGAGEVDFRVSVVVPKTDKLAVIMALFESGEEVSLVNESLVYRVSQGESSQGSDK